MPLHGRACCEVADDTGAGFEGPLVPVVDRAEVERTFVAPIEHG